MWGPEARVLWRSALVLLAPVVGPVHRHSAALTERDGPTALWDHQEGSLSHSKVKPEGGALCVGKRATVRPFAFSTFWPPLRATRAMPARPGGAALAYIPRPRSVPVQCDGD